jgi:hypothetical protein
MKVVSLLAGLLMVTAAPLASVAAPQTATLTTVRGFNAALHHSPLANDDLLMPKCFPHCGG